jgi:hypothetical protein
VFSSQFSGGIDECSDSLVANVVSDLASLTLGVDKLTPAQAGQMI